MGGTLCNQANTVARVRVEHLHEVSRRSTVSRDA